DRKVWPTRQTRDVIEDAISRLPLVARVEPAIRWTTEHSALVLRVGLERRAALGAKIRQQRTVDVHELLVVGTICKLLAARVLILDNAGWADRIRCAGLDVTLVIVGLKHGGKDELPDIGKTGRGLGRRAGL